MSSSSTSAAETRTTPVERASLWAGKLWFWLPIAPLVALDLWSKTAVFAFLDANPARPHVVFHWTDKVRFSLVTVWNQGTIWGLGQNLHGALVALRFVAIGVLLTFAARTLRHQRGTLVALGVILAGAIGNLWDNLTEAEPRHLGGGGVRDFLLFEFGPRYADFPAFNVADSCITCGAITLAILLWRSDGAKSAHS